MSELTSRLTDAELDEASEYARGSLRMTAIIAELRERRAADLTAEDLAALKFARDRVKAGLRSEAAIYFDDNHIKRYDNALVVIDKLLNAGGGL
jgi:hypothetical protein